MDISRFSNILQVVYHTLIFAACQTQNANNFVHCVDISYCELIEVCALLACPATLPPLPAARLTRIRARACFV